MTCKNITLKSIANCMGVSMTTVHRALYNKEGVSDETRKLILEKAQELGYRTNYVASSLKRKTIRIAVVIPSANDEGRYYYAGMWNAIHTYATEAQNLNVEVINCPYNESENALNEILTKLAFSSKPVDGLLIVPADKSSEIKIKIQMMATHHTAVVLIDNDISDCGRICCVAPHDTHIGRLGAEMFTLMHLPEGKILVAAGSKNSEAHVHNLKGFKEYLHEHGDHLTCIDIHHYDDLPLLYTESKKILTHEKDIVGFYATTARETVQITKAVIDLGLSGKIYGIGSDLFTESAKFLKENSLQAVIYKNAHDKGYLGFKILFEYLVKHIDPPGDKVSVPISIIMKNNLDFFTNRIV